MTKPVSPMKSSVFSSTDPELSSQAVSTAIATVQYSLFDSGKQFDHSLEIARFGELHVWNSRSSSGFTLRAEDPNYKRFELHFVGSGHYASKTDYQTVSASTGQAYLLRNLNTHNIVCHPQTNQVCVSIPEARFSRLVAEEFIEPYADLSALRPVVDCHELGIQHLKQLATLLIATGGHEQAGELSVGMHLLSEAFLALFIETWPTDIARRHQHVARPFYIKRAVEWMNAQVAQKITLEDLSAASGVSIRTLQLGFRKFLDVSPMGYLFRIRLDRAHNDLLTEPASVTVDDIARRWGFSNPGKFAAQIRLRYGQNPFAIRRSMSLRKEEP